jgi:diacylglycerol kinase (ATP)
MRFFFVINPSSGQGRGLKLQAEIRRHCEANGLDHEIWLWESRESNLPEALQRAKEAGFTHIVAVGGDGTVSQIAPHIVNTDITLCIIPNGTGNALARVYGIPFHIPSALQLLTNHQVYLQDVGTLDGRPFVSFAGFGIDADVAHSFVDVKNRSILGYFMSTVKNFMELRDESVRIVSPEGERQWHVGLCSFMNIAQFGGGFTLAPGASATDAALDIVSMRKFPLFTSPYIYYMVASGQIDKLKWYSRIRVSEATVYRTKKGKAQIDGDPVFVETEMKVGVLPKALRLGIPKGYRG